MRKFLLKAHLNWLLLLSHLLPLVDCLNWSLVLVLKPYLVSCYLSRLIRPSMGIGGLLFSVFFPFIERHT